MDCNYIRHNGPINRPSWATTRDVHLNSERLDTIKHLWSFAVDFSLLNVSLSIVLWLKSMQASPCERCMSDGRVWQSFPQRESRLVHELNIKVSKYLGGPPVDETWSLFPHPFCLSHTRRVLWILSHYSADHQVAGSHQDRQSMLERRMWLRAGKHWCTPCGM